MTQEEINRIEQMREIATSTAFKRTLENLFKEYPEIMEQLTDTEDKQKVIGILFGEAVALGVSLSKNATI